MKVRNGPFVLVACRSGRDFAKLTFCALRASVHVAASDTLTSIQLFAASGANGRKAGFQEIHTACPLITVLRQIQKLPLSDEQKNS